MGKIIVCNTKTAQNPYTFLNTKVSVYSYEELCYYCLLYTSDAADD